MNKIHLFHLTLDDLPKTKKFAQDKQESMPNRLTGVQGIKEDDKNANNVYNKAYVVIKTSL